MSTIESIPRSPLPEPVAGNPSASLLAMISGYRVTQALYVAAKLGIADHLSEGEKTADELAHATATHPRSLYRVLRALASVGVFVETPATGRFALTPMAQLLQREVSGSLHGQAVLMGEPWIWQVSGELLQSVRTGENSHARVFGADIWTYLSQRPEAQEIFNAAMTSLTALETEAIIAAYDFDGVATVVDVGGGHGALLAAILRAKARLTGVLFDRPPVIDGAGAVLDKAEISARCRVVGGDMFTAVPQGGDLYILKRVIHDWDDGKTVEIFRSCRAAMPAHARLLLAEPVILPGNAAHSAKFLDLQMLVSQGGCERTAAEFETLLNAAGFAVTRVIQTRFLLSLIEATPR